MKKGNIMIKLKSKKKITKIMFLAFIILFVLIFRIGYLQFVNGNYLQELAYEQQLKERAVSAKRGTIYSVSVTPFVYTETNGTINAVTDEYRITMTQWKAHS